MAIDERNLSELVKEIRRQLSLSQEDLARALGGKRFITLG